MSSLGSSNKFTIFLDHSTENGGWNYRVGTASGFAHTLFDALRIVFEAIRDELDEGPNP